MVHHTPSPGTQELLEAVEAGVGTEELVGVEVVVRAALGATVSDLLGADAVVVGTPANIGYMAGAVKHFFDTVYYPCLGEKRRMAYGLYVHGNSDTAGAVRAVEGIAAGMGWRAVQPAVTVLGAPRKADLEAVWNLGAMVAAEVAEGTA